MPTARVALISDAPEALVVETIRRDGARVLEVRPEDQVGLRALFASEPDAFVIDVRGANTLPEWVRKIRLDNLDAGIVILASELDKSLLVEAMRAGVNEVVAEPLTQEAISEAVRRASGFSSDVVRRGGWQRRRREQFSKDVTGLNKAIEYLKALNR